MENVKIEVKDNELVIHVALNVPGRLSSTGKSKLIASTGGFVAVTEAPGVGVSLNVNRK